MVKKRLGDLFATVTPGIRPQWSLDEQDDQARVTTPARAIKNGSDYRVNTETALTASISTYFALKLSFDWRRVNRPPTGAVKDDTKTSIALVVDY